MGDVGLPVRIYNRPIYILMSQGCLGAKLRCSRRRHVRIFHSHSPFHRILHIYIPDHPEYCSILFLEIRALPSSSPTYYKCGMTGIPTITHLFRPISHNVITIGPTFKSSCYPTYHEPTQRALIDPSFSGRLSMITVNSGSIRKTHRPILWQCAMRMNGTYLHVPLVACR